MTRGILAALAIVMGAPAVQHAQEQPSDMQARRNQIHLMEGVLQRAGSIAAEAFGLRLQQIEPTMAVTIGQSRAKGFVLDGYGIFFDVEVPELRTTVLLAQAMVQRDLEIENALTLLKRALESMPAGVGKQQAERAVRVLDLQVGPIAPPDAAAQSLVSTSQADPAVKVGTLPAPAPDSMAPAPEPVALRPDVQALIKDPRKEYRDTVQRHLIDVMLDYSPPMNVPADQWLAVAARVTEAGQRGQVLMLRLKGSDLAALAADKSRRDEIRSRVEVSVF